MKRTWIYSALATIVGIVVIDHAAKIAVFRTMHRGQSIPILGDWLQLTYTENPGMAFGLTFGPPSMITIFSIIATFLIIFYMVRVGSIHRAYRISLTLVVGGALGNIVDRVFYGKILYGDPYFLGRVVDFIHVNVWRGYLPEWIPLLGGSYLALFPIWNIADMAIVLGVVGILVFQSRFHQAAEDLMKSRQAGKESTPGAPETLPADPGRDGDDSRQE